MWFKAKSAIEQREGSLTQHQNPLGPRWLMPSAATTSPSDRLQATFIQTCAPVGRTAVTNLTLDARSLSYWAVGVYLLVRR